MQIALVEFYKNTQILWFTSSRMSLKRAPFVKHTLRYSHLHKHTYGTPAEKSEQIIFNSSVKIRCSDTKRWQSSNRYLVVLSNHGCSCMIFVSVTSTLGLPPHGCNPANSQPLSNALYHCWSMDSCTATKVGRTPKAGYTLFAFHRYFTNVFTKHTTKYETLAIHFSHFMLISCFINATKK